MLESCCENVTAWPFRGNRIQETKSMSNATLNVTVMTNTFEAVMSCSRDLVKMRGIWSNIFRFCSEDSKQRHETVSPSNLS